MTAQPAGIKLHAELCSLYGWVALFVVQGWQQVLGGVWGVAGRPVLAAVAGTFCVAGELRAGGTNVANHHTCGVPAIC